MRNFKLCARSEKVFFRALGTQRGALLLRFDRAHSLRKQICKTECIADMLFLLKRYGCLLQIFRAILLLRTLRFRAVCHLRRTRSFRAKTAAIPVVKNASFLFVFGHQRRRYFRCRFLSYLPNKKIGKLPFQKKFPTVGNCGGTPAISTERLYSLLPTLSIG